MSNYAADEARPARAVPSGSDLYRAVWRWHFYAGLLVLPFLVSLAVTGALYLFRDGIDAIIHAGLKTVAVPAEAKALSASHLIEAALSAHPGTVVKFTTPATRTASAEVTIAAEDGARLAVYVDPYSGRVLGTLPDRGTIMWTIRQLHSLEFFGPIGRGLIELAGGWSILLVATGLYLWWPRSGSRAFALRGAPRHRLFWRDLHAVLGFSVAGFILFLAITGMPWSILWGAKVNEWANGSNFGYPAGVRVAVPMSGEHLHHLAPTSWSLEQAQMPSSTSSAGADRPITLDDAMVIFARLDLAPGFTVNLPTSPTGVYTASVYPDDLSQQRVVHLDQYTGEPLIDMSFADYGPLGKALEWGINVHMGQEFGRANQVILALVCLGIIALALSAAVMWWKRRPHGSLGIPPDPADPRVFRGVLLCLAIGGIIFPLVGLSLLVIGLLDWLGTRVWRRATPA
ncbi:PepSY-associated TM helix domain-containing protein [Rhodoligotrophos ferricapiens]|uniref:PepSY-associated TM helix domain-containing protein n=1 Tax=Rhodoligotrophos ferricapiens TaxID=3069264 RepID=UPI00315DCE43